MKASQKRDTLVVNTARGILYAITGQLYDVSIYENVITDSQFITIQGNIIPILNADAYPADFSLNSPNRLKNGQLKKASENEVADHVAFTVMCYAVLHGQCNLASVALAELAFKDPDLATARIENILALFPTTEHNKRLLQRKRWLLRGYLYWQNLLAHANNADGSASVYVPLEPNGAHVISASVPPDRSLLFDPSIWHAKAAFPDEWYYPYSLGLVASRSILRHTKLTLTPTIPPLLAVA